MILSLYTSSDSDELVSEVHVPDAIVREKLRDPLRHLRFILAWAEIFGEQPPPPAEEGFSGVCVAPSPDRPVPRRKLVDCQADCPIHRLVDIGAGHAR
jgi:hypothetical protein